MKRGDLVLQFESLIPLIEKGEYVEGYCPFPIMSQVLEEKGFKLDKEYPETNGWEIDYHVYFTKNDKKWILNGSMYYGYFGIELEEED